MVKPSTHWPRALALLDVAMAMPVAQREHWLAQTATLEPDVSELVRKLLLAHGRVETHEILGTLPKVQRRKANSASGAAGMQVGPFELIEPLGRGGMGSVWRARYADGRLKRDVAVKLPSSTDDPAALATLRERFARERDFLAQLEHPNIARLYEAGISESGQPFLAMEYVAGQPIDAYCDAGQLGVKARLNLFLQVLDAVAYANQRLVLHRDLKPGNVLVDSQGQVRLLDFGVARLLPPQDVPSEAPSSSAGRHRAGDRSDLTERAGAAFTLGYAAPEQLTNGVLSTATDVYSLGVMLYRLLTGLSPYQPARDTRGGLEDAVLLDVPAAASARADSPTALAASGLSAPAMRQALRGDIDVMLAKALKKAPKERYASAAMLAEDVRRHLQQQPIAARPDRWSYRTGLFITRHRLAVALSAAAVLVLVGTAGVAIWQAHTSAQNAAKAMKEAARATATQKFFADLMSNADPDKNSNITAANRRLIDQALTDAQRDFAPMPETLALVLKQLADIYFRLGDKNKYLQIQKQRNSLLQALPETAVDERLRAQIALGSALTESPQPADQAQALPTLLAAREYAVAQRGSDQLLVQVLSMIANAYLFEVNYAQANDYAVLAVQHAERTLKSPQGDLALAYDAGGLMASKLGDFDRALEYLRKSIAVDASGKARGASAQLNTRVLLANVLHESGDYTAAKREAMGALEFARVNLAGIEAPLAPARMRAVLAAERSGDIPEAARLASTLLATELASGDSFRQGSAQYAMGVVEMAQGHLAQAAQAFAAAEAGLSNSTRWRANLIIQQATLKLRLGQPAAALELLQPLWQKATAAQMQSTEQFSQIAERMALAFARQSDLARAQPMFDSACAWRRKTLQAAHPDRVRCEAYVLLASTSLAPTEKADALLQQQQQFVRGRADSTALATSLRTAAGWVVGAASTNRFAPEFPILP